MATTADQMQEHTKKLLVQAGTVAARMRFVGELAKQLQQNFSAISDPSKDSSKLDFFPYEKDASIADSIKEILNKLHYLQAVCQLTSATDERTAWQTLRSEFSPRMRAIIRKDYAKLQTLRNQSIFDTAAQEQYLVETLYRDVLTLQHDHQRLALQARSEGALAENVKALEKPLKELRDSIRAGVVDQKAKGEIDAGIERASDDWVARLNEVDEACKKTQMQKLRDMYVVSYRDLDAAYKESRKRSATETYAKAVADYGRMRDQILKELSTLKGETVTGEDIVVESSRFDRWMSHGYISHMLTDLSTREFTEEEAKASLQETMQQLEARKADLTRRLEGVWDAAGRNIWDGAKLRELQNGLTPEQTHLVNSGKGIAQYIDGAPSQAPVAAAVVTQPDLRPISKDSIRSKLQQQLEVRQRKRGYYEGQAEWLDLLTTEEENALEAMEALQTIQEKIEKVKINQEYLQLQGNAAEALAQANEELAELQQQVSVKERALEQALNVAVTAARQEQDRQQRAWLAAQPAPVPERGTMSSFEYRWHEWNAFASPRRWMEEIDAINAQLTEIRSQQIPATERKLQAIKTEQAGLNKQIKTDAEAVSIARQLRARENGTQLLEQVYKRSYERYRAALVDYICDFATAIGLKDDVRVMLRGDRFDELLTKLEDKSVAETDKIKFNSFVKNAVQSLQRLYDFGDLTKENPVRQRLNELSLEIQVLENQFENTFIELEPKSKEIAAAFRREAGRAQTVLSKQFSEVDGVFDQNQRLQFAADLFATATMPSPRTSGEMHVAHLATSVPVLDSLDRLKHRLMHKITQYLETGKHSAERVAEARSIMSEIKGAADRVAVQSVVTDWQARLVTENQTRTHEQGKTWTEKVKHFFYSVFSAEFRLLTTMKDITAEINAVSRNNSVNAYSINSMETVSFRAR